MFEEMVRNIQDDAVKVILNTRVDKNRIPERQKVAQPISASHGEQGRKPVVRSSKKWVEMTVVHVEVERSTKMLRNR